MKNEFIIFDEKSHTYHDITGIEYTSISKLLSSLSKPFDAKKMAPLVARKRDRESKEKAKSLRISQAEILMTYPKYKRGITTEEVLQEWLDQGDSSRDVGNRIHEALEKYSNTTEIDLENIILKEMIIAVNNQFSDYSKVFQEVILHSIKYKTAGTADKLCFRTRNIDGTVDVYDYKTNESRGIEFISKYGDFFADPLCHMEDCNYNKYVMQESCYGVMLEEMFGCKIGKMALIFIPPTDPNNFKLIPVPYMKKEAIALMETNVEVEWMPAREIGKVNDMYIPDFKLKG